MRANLLTQFRDIIDLYRESLLLLLLFFFIIINRNCHSVTVVLTLVQTKQIRINIHKGNNTKNTVQTIRNTVNISLHITMQV